MSYQWDNVAYYDYTFRQLMAEHPQRSWAKTYAQLWQLVLRDPIQKSSWNSNSNTAKTKTSNMCKVDTNRGETDVAGSSINLVPVTDPGAHMIIAVIIVVHGITGLILVGKSMVMVMVMDTEATVQITIGNKG